MASGPAVLRFQRGLPHSMQFGERLRILFIQGPNKGTCFSLLGDLIFLGRDDVQIQLSDANLSRKHAEISWRDGNYSIRDLGSANGVIHNGIKVANAVLRPGDIVIVGSSVFEVYSSSQVKKTEKPTISATAKKLRQSAQEAEAQAKKDPVAEKKKREVERKRLFVFLALFFVIYFAFFSEEEKPATFRERGKIESEEVETKKSNLSKKDIKIAISEYMPDYKVDTQQRKDAQIFFRTGVRELQNKNYRRAITAFETALTVDSSHDLSKVYLKTAKKEMESDLIVTMKAARMAKASLRYKEARMHYQNVMRYLDGDQKLVRKVGDKEVNLYDEAKDALKDIDKEDGQLR